MQYEEFSWYSDRVKRNMSIKIYGHYGVPIIVFPCQGKQSDDFSNNGMIDTLSPLINEGKIKLFCLDSNDGDTVSYKGWDKAHAAYLLEQYHQYVIEEVLPFIYLKQGGKCLPYLMGCSMGGGHASNNFFRRPELFSGFLSISGRFDLASFFDGYQNDDVYNNSPTEYMANISNDHPYINIYNSKRMIALVGQGSYEHLVLYSNYWLKDICNSKGINAWIDIKDQSFIHDWCSWKEYALHYVNLLIN